MNNCRFSLVMLIALQVHRITALEALKGFVSECAEAAKTVEVGCGDTKFHECLATKTSTHAVLKVMSANLKTLICMVNDRANVLLAKRGQVSLLSPEKINTADDAVLDRVLEVIRTGGVVKSTGKGDAEKVKSEELRKPLSFEMKQGIVNVLDKSGKLVIPVPSRDEFLDDLAEINKLAVDKAIEKAARSHLDSLLARFLDYKAKNWKSEREEQKKAKAGGRGNDFYRVTKVLKEGNLKIQTITVDVLDVFAQQETWSDFTAFNRKYGPFGQSVLRAAMLKYDTKLGAKNFAGMLTISGFDCVDDESLPGISPFNKASPTPDLWKEAENPPFDYYLFYMYANIAVLNQLRSARNLRTLNFRPHCGEAGSWKHLSTCFLLADGINHGIKLKYNAPLQFAYYLAQLPIAVSPLSNNKLFLKLKNNPFNLFFSQGLNVSLSTDDPLMFHYSAEPLREEYYTAGHHWSLDAADLCEIARNSVYQYGLNPKRKWEIFGKEFMDAWANDVVVTNVPNGRIAYRKRTYEDSLNEIIKAAK